ncbi:MAG TPA: arginine--tRNA ligase [Bryobacteraceae bacterium]|nr:arginine--tRNA ligase [Bryobacteraceae bacterium]
MFHRIEKNIFARVVSFLRGRYEASLPAILEEPKQASFGELSITAPFHLARQLKRAPASIAREIVAEIGPIEGVAALEVAGNGYINVRVERGGYAAAILQGSDEAREQIPGKIIVEHTNINPNKAAHIGHLRNAVLGDTFVRMLKARSRTVEVQNYIDNTGVQVADVVAGFHFLRKMSFGDVDKLIEDAGVRFDYYCWDLYAEVSAHPELKDWRLHTLHAIEHREGDLVHLASRVSEVIVGCHLATMARLGVGYDLLPRESDVVWLKFWETAFEQLKQRKAIYFETEGKNKGCWVMPASAFKEQTGEDTEDSKVIVRSNNTVTYVGKDIAYQLWKFGLLAGKDFYYRPWPGKNVYITTAEPQPGVDRAFGHGDSVYNVIDSRQSYLQDVVVAGLRALGYESQADRSIHFSYEMVALSPRTCVELGIELSDEDKKRPYVEVSGRKGLGVKADDLIDKLIEKALEEVDSRHPEAPAAERKQVATQIAIGALRYFMLKFTRNSVIAFDLGEALSFEGDTGPYVQYTAVRAGNILRKLAERGEALPDFMRDLNQDALARQLASEDFWQLLLMASKSDSAIERAIASGEPAHVAKYAFQLAQAFNNFYHSYPVLTEENREKRVFLLWMTTYFRAQLERTLAVLGIAVPEYM